MRCGCNENFHGTYGERSANLQVKKPNCSTDAILITNWPHNRQDSVLAHVDA